jgi:hypothetical protein
MSIGLSQLIQQAWRTLGLPLRGDVLFEREHGVIDPEALLIITLVAAPDVRYAADIAAWLLARADWVNQQKLKSLYVALPPQYREAVNAHVLASPFTAVPVLTRLTGSKPADAALVAQVRDRARKLAPKEVTAAQSRTIHNRLLFGTGARADVVTLLESDLLDRNGAIIARLLCTTESTISRVLTDLRAAQFVDKRHRLTANQVNYPRPFITAVSVWNICRRLDAGRFKSRLLAQSELAQIDVTFDNFGASLAQ